jgi:hypothetical protein
MSVDLSEFKRTRDRRCVVARALDLLDGLDLEKLQAALLAPDISQSDISRWLSKRSISVGASTVGAHRAQRCGCPDA